jgi:hypothetical protein
MLRRCESQTDKSFGNYGGRGITVCEQWRSSPETFFSDMGPRPSPDHSIDRYPDKNGDYEPGNCRWATSSEQNRNRRNTKLTEAQASAILDDPRSQRVIAAEYGVSQRAVWSIKHGIFWTLIGRGPSMHKVTEALRIDDEAAP